MSRTIKFYNVGIYLNDKLTDISFIEFVDKINAIQHDRSKVVRKVEDKISAIFEFVNNSDKKNVRVIPIGQFRVDLKPYIGEMQKLDLKCIDQDVIELVTLYYNDLYKACALTNNPNGLKVKDIEKYFNTYFKLTSEKKWEIRFEPIIINKGIEKIENTKQIKNISIKLNLEASTKKFTREKLDINENSIIKALSRSTKDTYDANVLKLEFGVGDKKSATMDLEAAINLLSKLDIDTDYISEVNVRYKDNATQKIDYIDLKKDTVELKDVILKNSSSKNPAEEIISEEIKNSIENHQRCLVKAKTEFIDSAINEVLPDLILRTPEANLVQLGTIEENNDVIA